MKIYNKKNFKKQYKKNRAKIESSNDFEKIKKDLGFEHMLKH